MIGWAEIYKVAAAVAPLYVALMLGYASIKWWRMFTADQCDAINRFNCYFVFPFFTLYFTAGVNPYRMNFRFLAADVIAKAIAGAALALCVTWGRKGNFAWAITSFSLSSFSNTLVVGVPLLQAMYGATGGDLAVQSSVIQFVLWTPILLFMYEFWRNRVDQQRPELSSIEIGAADADDTSTAVNVDGADANDDKNAAINVDVTDVNDTRAESNVDVANANDIRTMGDVDGAVNGAETDIGSSNHSSVSVMTKVGAKLGKNPNCYACVIGIIWALIANRRKFEMPSIVEGSILIMANAGSGVAMFTIGLFMALNKKIIACGMKLTAYSMILRFLIGPLTTAIGSLALGLRSNILRIAIMQAALSQAVASFIFAQEYGLHVNVLSTAIIFGTIVSLPLLIAYYAILDVLH